MITLSMITVLIPVDLERADTDAIRCNYGGYRCLNVYLEYTSDANFNILFDQDLLRTEPVYSVKVPE